MSLIVLGGGVAVVVGVALSPPGALQADGMIDGSGRHVVLEPEQWVSRPFPLGPYLDGGVSFDEGTWEVVLARPGCPHCLAYLESWTPDTEQAVIVSLGGEGSDLDGAAQRLDISVYTLDPDKRWYAELPVILQLEGGIVTTIDMLGGREDKSTENTEQSSPPLLPDPATDLDLTDAVWFNDEGQIDLGYITPGAEITLAYRITAPPSHPLQFLGIHSECKCTTITHAPERIEAGEQGIVAMRFVATDKPLAYNQGVLIRTDHPDPGLAERRLVVTARIGLPLAVTPDRLSVADTDQPSLSVTVTNDGAEPIRLIYAVAESPGVAAQVPRNPIPPGGSVEVPVVIDPERWNHQPTRIRIPTTAKTQPDLFIEVQPR